MSEHVLVPLDGSSNAENAVPYAGRLAQMFGLPLTFVHVADNDEATDDKSSERFAEYAGGLIERFGLGECPFTTVSLKGVPAREILKEAQDASFVVLASHGRGGFRATFMGSVADKVVRGAAAPVLVVPGVGRPSEPDFAPAVVALDGSKEAEVALTMARRIVQPTGRHLTLVRAYRLPAATGAGAGYAYYPMDIIDILERGAREYLDEVADEGDDKIVVQSDAAGAIRDAADQIDAKLVVMAASGKGLAGRLALGSTTDRVMHSLHRPLLITPAAAAD